MVGLSKQMSVRIETYLSLIKSSRKLDSEVLFSPNSLTPVIGIEPELEYLEKIIRRERIVFVLASSLNSY